MAYFRSGISNIQKYRGDAVDVAGLPAPIASFQSNVSGVNLSALKVLVTAQQDLHGYDKPWAGGGGTNKMPDVFNPLPSNGALLVEYPNEISFAGMYMSFLFSGSFSTLGGAFIQARDSANNVTVTFTFSNLSDSNGNILVAGNTYTNELVHLNYSQTKAVKKWNFYRNWNPADGCTIKNFQLSIGSTATSYAPYENICPITGWSGANVTRTGKNLWGGEALLQSFIDANITGFVYDTTAKTLTYYASAMTGKNILSNFKFKENTQYTLILRGSNALNYNATNLRVWYSDGTNSLVNFPQAQANVKQTCVFTSSSGKTIDRIAGVNASGTVTLYYDECGLFEGVVTASDFESFVGNPYSSYFSGILNGTYAYYTFTGEEEWIAYGSGYRTVVLSSAKYKALTGSEIPTNVIANVDMPFISRNSISNGASGLSITEDTILASDYSDLAGKTIIYELATPATPTITQAQMDTLVKAFGVEKMSAIFVFGDTYYGGELDVTNGVLRVLYEKYKLPSTGWVFSSNRYQKSDVLPVGEYYSDKNVMCDTYPKITLAQAGQGAKGVVMGYNSHYIYFYITEDFPTLSDWTTYLTNNDVYITRPLATPIEIQLTPQQIEQLLGDNNVFADCGDVEELKKIQISQIGG